MSEPAPQVAPMAVADLDEVLAIEARSYPLPWTRDVFLTELGHSWSSCVVLRAPGGPLLGYAVFWMVSDEAELLNVAVAPDARGRGHGHALVAHVLEAARARGMGAVFLEVRASNAPAIALYRHHGFVQLAVRPRYYRDNDEDALILRCPLGPEATP